MADQVRDLDPERVTPRYPAVADPLASSIATHQAEAMVAAWRRGERPRAEEFLARVPGLGEEAALRLIYEEICLRQEAGLEVDPDEFVARFPRWRAELEVF